MARFSYHDLPYFWRKGSPYFLAFSWISGLVCGIVAFSSACDFQISWMRGVPYGSVSIVSMLCVTCLPFLFSAFAVYLSKPAFLLLISFGKAFCFSFISLGVQFAFGSAGWLVRWLLCFSGCISAPVLYLYWLRHIDGGKGFSWLETLCFLSVFLLMASFDFVEISPFLASLIL